MFSNEQNPVSGEPQPEQDLAIHLRNGSSILVKGSFHPDSLRGEGLDFVVLTKPPCHPSTHT